MNPKPLASLNHLTSLLTYSRSLKGKCQINREKRLAVSYRSRNVNLRNQTRRRSANQATGQRKPEEDRNPIKSEGIIHCFERGVAGNPGGAGAAVFEARLGLAEPPEKAR